MLLCYCINVRTIPPFVSVSHQPIRGIAICSMQFVIIDQREPSRPLRRGAAVLTGVAAYDRPSRSEPRAAGMNSSEAKMSASRSAMLGQVQDSSVRSMDVRSLTTGKMNGTATVATFLARALDVCTSSLLALDVHTSGHHTRPIQTRGYLPRISPSSNPSALPTISFGPCASAACGTRSTLSWTRMSGTSAVSSKFPERAPQAEELNRLLGAVRS